MFISSSRNVCSSLFKKGAESTVRQSLYSQSSLKTSRLIFEKQLIHKSYISVEKELPLCKDNTKTFSEREKKFMQDPEFQKMIGGQHRDGDVMKLSIPKMTSKEILKKFPKD